MTEKKNTDSQPGGDAADWVNQMTDFWSPLMATWGKMFSTDATAAEPEAKGRMNESMAAMTKLWKTMLGAMSEPGEMGNFQKISQVAPDIVLDFTQTFMQGFFKFQSQANEWMLKRGEDAADFDVQAFDQEFINRWTEMYENELSQYMNMPQIGLGRVYQERVLNAADELNRFQAAFAGFLNLLYLPMEKSFKTMQEKMTEMAKDGPMDDKSKTYYNLWIKELEGHYMELYKTEEFSDTLGDTLTALNTFSEARQAVTNDVLKMHSIPTNKELEDLYKEIYLLKKRVRACEKQ